MTTKRVGLVTVAQLDIALPWVLALTAYCDALLVVAKSPALLAQLAAQLDITHTEPLAASDVVGRPCVFEFVQADLGHTEGQGRLTDLIRQRGPLYCAVNLCGHQSDAIFATAGTILSDASKVSMPQKDVPQSTFVDAAMDTVLASVRRDIDATLLLSQAVLAGMKQSELGVLMQVWIEGPINSNLKPLHQAASQFVEQFSMGIATQLGEAYPNIKVQYFRWASVPAENAETAVVNTPKALFSEVFNADFLARQ